MEIGFSAMENARAASEDCRPSTPPKLALEIATLGVFKVRLYPRFCAILNAFFGDYENHLRWFSRDYFYDYPDVTGLFALSPAYGGVATEICSLRDT